MANSRRDKKKKTIIFFVVCCTLALIFIRWTWKTDDSVELSSESKKELHKSNRLNEDRLGRQQAPAENDDPIFERFVKEAVRGDGANKQPSSDSKSAKGGAGDGNGDVVKDSPISNSVDDRLFITDTNEQDRDDTLYIWPPPRTVSELNKNRITIDPDFSVKVSSPSSVLAEGIQRYEDIIRNKSLSSTVAVECSKAAVRHVTIELESDGEDLGLDTSYQYSLMISGKMGITIHAASPYGALYGLETFSQLVQDGCLLYDELHIEDYPRYRHRGLMLDTGRRMVPKPLILNIMDAMSFLKLNVFHWHFSDFCIFSIQSKEFPELTADLSAGQFYTSEDVKEVVEYARKRGIRVIPELDLPYHARGLRPLDGKGLHFCDSQSKQIYNDPKGESLNTLKKLVTELAAMFPDKYFHIGCDESRPTVKCTAQSTKDLELAMAKHVISLDKVPVAWEEAHLSVKLTEVVSEMVIQAWSNTKAADIAKGNIMSIESDYRNFYFDLDFVTADNAWQGQIGFSEDTNYLNKYILGGEFAMWTDEWCPVKQCFDTSAPKPVAHWMYDSKNDDTFVLSLSGLLWPRGIAAAGNFWNFQADLVKEDRNKMMDRHLMVMTSRGVMACPAKCKCDYLHQCNRTLHL